MGEIGGTSKKSTFGAIEVKSVRNEQITMCDVFANFLHTTPTTLRWLKIESRSWVAVIDSLSNLCRLSACKLS